MAKDNMKYTIKTGNSYGEYRDFLIEFLFPLLGISKNNNVIRCDEQEEQKFRNKLVFQEGGDIFFCNNKKALYKVCYPREMSKDNINLSINIIRSFLKVSKYKIDFENSSIKNSYYSDIQCRANYKMAVQKGICNWVLGRDNDKLEELFEILERWAVQTYEGKKVTFGFIINPQAKSTFDTTHGTWGDFLKDDFSAVFTDCINTVIELDRDCNFSRYLSITENNHIEGYDLSYKSAFRFSNVIQKYVVNNCVGIFLLNNGDIILSKNGAVQFVKRNLKWLNFSYEAFRSAFHDFEEENKVSDVLFESIFASMLDVSFSHTGGIISLVKNVDKLLSDGEKVSDNEKRVPILSPCDYLLNHISDKEMEEYLGGDEALQSDKNKCILKRKVLETLVNGKKFTTLDRKLRSELISLDGAFIIDMQGNVCACGAIIKNDSGSTGGGRGAASKKLSNYGFSIKISTDGYIELYIDGKERYSIK